MALELVDLLLPVALALGLGAVIGLERERHRPDKVVLAGVRTYPLVSLSGLLAALLSQELEVSSLVSVGAFIVGGFALLMYWVRQAHGVTGLTSPLALFATYFIGVLVGVDRWFEAIVTGLAIALLLFTKERLHRLAEVMSPQEMEGALYFLVLAFILFPIAPVDPVDPWGLLRVRSILLLVLLVSLMSFLSFLVMRRWGGAYGLPFSGFVGGLVNSEATAANLAQLQRQRPGLRHAAYLGVLLATATMFVRNLVIAAIADPDLRLLRSIWLPMALPPLVFLVWAVAQMPDGRSTRSVLRLESPFAFKPAFLFAFWFTLVSVATLLIARIPGLESYGVYVAALGGFASAGAVVASMAALVAAEQVPLAAAAATAVLASLLSASNKLLITRLSDPSLARRLLLPVAAGLFVGAVALLWYL